MNLVKSGIREENMNNIENRHYDPFDLFGNRWALISAGTPDHFNGCTVSWGSFGKLWTRDKDSGYMITVYIHPARYTSEFMLENDQFTVSFFPPEYKKALAVMGSHSGRNEDKTRIAGLTPVPFGNSVDFEEASLSFLCKKVYQHQFAVEDIAQEVQDYYASNPKVYPSEEEPGWQPHIVFIGEILDVIDTEGQ